MPYLNASKREYFSSLVSEIIDTRIEVAGDLNYLFTMLIKEYIKQNGECYKHYNDCIGSLEACKLELYRRQVGNYEEQAILKNGDVYYE